MENALSGASVLNVKGSDYGFRIDEHNEHGEAEVLIPQRKGYRSG